MPTNCSELYKLGHRIDGFYPVKNNNNDNNIKGLDIIYCVFDQPFSSLSSGININNSRQYIIDLRSTIFYIVFKFWILNLNELIMKRQGSALLT